MEFCCNSIHRFARSDAVRVVGVRNRIRAFGYGGQPPAVLPGELISIAVTERVADLIVGDGLAVKAGQQVLPLAVSIFISVLYLSVQLYGSQVTARVIDVFRGVRSLDGLYQLVQAVILIGVFQLAVSGIICTGKEYSSRRHRDIL